MADEIADFRGDYAFLSNFYAAAVELDGCASASKLLSLPFFAPLRGCVNAFALALRSTAGDASIAPTASRIIDPSALPGEHGVPCPYSAASKPLPLTLFAPLRLCVDSFALALEPGLP